MRKPIENIIEEPDQEIHEEPIEQKILYDFLESHVKDVQEKDTLATRIESLRQYIEIKMGTTLFMNAYGYY